MIFISFRCVHQKILFYRVLHVIFVKCWHNWLQCLGQPEQSNENRWQFDIFLKNKSHTLIWKQPKALSLISVFSHMVCSSIMFESRILIIFCDVQMASVLFCKFYLVFLYWHWYQYFDFLYTLFVWVFRLYDIICPLVEDCVERWTLPEGTDVSSLDFLDFIVTFTEWILFFQWTFTYNYLCYLFQSRPYFQIIYFIDYIWRTQSFFSRCESWSSMCFIERNIISNDSMWQVIWWGINRLIHMIGN